MLPKCAKTSEPKDEQLCITVHPINNNIHDADPLDNPNNIVQIDPKPPPNLEYITAIESGCTELGQQDADEPSVDINRVLRSSQPQPNLTKAQS